ncbi:hypothetical protein CP157_04014 (plasmid) [Paracoccus marcusii]|jgi:hypothetical protein|uniref:hypothetical protein n=1 Tax=Paracoccus marcusii TaxID=59779 RepID=UPI001C3C955E|nr:hypothetical protein [Paracoccus marcusii]QXI66222.1 hypothetical protein CP157_04014 [Paracoccus marcusii]
MAVLEATFETRREAEMSIERLVQEFGLDRKAIEIVADGALNSAGEDTSGGDNAADTPTPSEREDAALNDRIKVSVTVDDEAEAERVRNAFSEFGGDRS